MRREHLARDLATLTDLAHKERHILLAVVEDEQEGPVSKDLARTLRRAEACTSMQHIADLLNGRVRSGERRPAHS